MNGLILLSLGGNVFVYNIKIIGMNEFIFGLELDYDIELLS